VTRATNTGIGANKCTFTNFNTAVFTGGDQRHAKDNLISNTNPTVLASSVQANATEDINSISISILEALTFSAVLNEDGGTHPLKDGTIQ